MSMYRVLKSVIEGKSVHRRQASELSAESQVDGDAAKLLNAQMEAAAKRGLGNIGATSIGPSIEAPDEGEPPIKVAKVRVNADSANKPVKVSSRKQAKVNSYAGLRAMKVELS